AAGPGRPRSSAACRWQRYSRDLLRSLPSVPLQFSLSRAADLDFLLGRWRTPSHATLTFAPHFGGSAPDREGFRRPDVVALSASAGMCPCPSAHVGGRFTRSTDTCHPR